MDHFVANRKPAARPHPAFNAFFTALAGSSGHGSIRRTPVIRQVLHCRARTAPGPNGNFASRERGMRRDVPTGLEDPDPATREAPMAKKAPPGAVRIPHRSRRRRREAARPPVGAPPHAPPATISTQRSASSPRPPGSGRAAISKRSWPPPPLRASATRATRPPARLWRSIRSRHGSSRRTAGSKRSHCRRPETARIASPPRSRTLLAPSATGSTGATRHRVP